MTRSLFTIALRNIFRQRRRSLLTATTIIGGYVLLSLSLGLSEGSYSILIDSFTGNYTGHLQVHGAGYLDSPSMHKHFAVTPQLKAKLEDPAVLSWTPRIHTQALAFANNRSLGIRLVGIDLIRERQTTRFSKNISQGKFLSGAKEILVGEGVAKMLKLSIGDNIFFVGQGVDGSIANEQLTVVGTIDGSSDSIHYRAVYMSLTDASEFLALDDRVHELVLMTENAAAGHILSQRLQADIADLSVDSWQVVEAEFYRAMVTDKNGNIVSLGIVTLIMALAVLNTILMATLERTREFGLMMALGTRPAHLALLPIGESFILSAMAGTLGMGIALALNSILVVRGIPLPEPIAFAGYQFSEMFSEVSVFTILFPFLITVVCSISVSGFAALRVARMQPIDAMRSH